MITACARRFAWLPSPGSLTMNGYRCGSGERQVRPARVGQRDALARQPFGVAVLAEWMTASMRYASRSQNRTRDTRAAARDPRRGARVVVLAARAGRLDADEHVARAPAGDRENACRSVGSASGRLAFVQRIAHGRRQPRETRDVVGQRKLWNAGRNACTAASLVTPSVSRAISASPSGGRSATA